MPTDRRLQGGFAERLAGGVLDIVGTSPPVDLHAVATHLGVTSVRFTTMKEDGRTTWVNGSPAIELRCDRTPQRTRFTFAHELAHVVLAEDRETAVRRTLALTHDDEETLCDWVAAALLMPYEWIRSFVRPDMNLSLLRLIANRADVSLSAATVRIAEAGRRLCMLLRWKRGDDRWVLMGQAGVPAPYRGYLEISDEANDQLDTLPSRRDLWRDLTLVLDGNGLSCHAQVDRLGPTCLMLVTSVGPEQTRSSLRS